jgi:hypothetical protein
LSPLSGEVLDGALVVGLLAVALLNARPVGGYAPPRGENACIPTGHGARIRPAPSVGRVTTRLRALTRPINAEDLCCPAPVAVAPGDGSSLLRRSLVPDRRP